MTLHAVNNSNEDLSDAELREETFAYWCAMRKPNAPAVARYMGLPLSKIDSWRKTGEWLLKKEVLVSEERAALLVKVRPADAAAISTLDLCGVLKDEIAKAVNESLKPSTYVKLRELQTATNTLDRI